MVLFLTVEVSFFTANIAKVEHGAWLPLVVALVISIVMINWRRGQEIVTRNRTAKEGSLTEFLDRLSAEEPPPTRFPAWPSTSIRPRRPPRWRSGSRSRTPTRSTQRVVIVSVDMVSIPHVEDFERFTVEEIGRRFQGVPRDGQERLPRRRSTSRPRCGSAASRVCSNATSTSSTPPTSSRESRSSPPTPRRCGLWRKKLFVAMARNATSPIDAFQLPSEKTVIVGSQIAL